jgi:hypothetical protein
MNDWISVKDSLPRNDEHVLIFDGDLCYVAYTKNGGRSWEENATGCGCCSTDINPTHWMSILEPTRIRN